MTDHYTDDETPGGNEKWPSSLDPAILMILNLVILAGAVYSVVAFDDPRRFLGIAIAVCAIASCGFILSSARGSR